MISTLDDALGWLERGGALSLTPNGALPSLVEQVAGEPVKGSWWKHPRGGDIFQLASALDDHPDVLAVKLVRGKVVFLHRALWPALLRVVSDPLWREPRVSRLTLPAAKLLKSVEKCGRVRMDELAEELDAPTRKRLTRDREALEKALLVHSGQLHTASGKHATVLTRWTTVAEERGVAPATTDYADALAKLEAACRGEPIGA
ncbi:MAG: hypothetical protein ACK4N5_22570 [Myxococcales bacterium]